VDDVGQQSILGRIAQMTKANINSLLDAAEDPEKMLDQMIRDYKNNIAEAEEAVAQTIGNLRMMEEDAKEASDTAAEWGSKAQAAANKTKELAAAGNTTEAATFENLARVALKKQIDFEQDAKELAPTIAQQNEVVNKLKSGLEGMRGKLDDLESKRGELIARAKMAEAQAGVMDAVGEIDLTDPTSELSRFEEKIRREEAKVAGKTELAASRLDAQFTALEEEGTDAEVEARLAELTGGTTAALPAGRTTSTS
jgi:phage shock protein A